MNRYTLPRQANLLFGIFNAATLWLLLFLANSSIAGAPAKLVFMVTLGAAVSMTIPNRFIRWMTDQRPLLGAIILSLMHYYFLYLGTACFMVVSEGRFESLSTLGLWLSERGVYLLFVPIGGAILAALLVCPFLTSMTLIGAGTFCHLSQRRDYL